MRFQSIVIVNCQSSGIRMCVLCAWKSGNIFSRFFICDNGGDAFCLSVSETSLPNSHRARKFLKVLHFYLWFASWFFPVGYLYSVDFQLCALLLVFMFFPFHSFVVRHRHSRLLSETFRMMDFSTTPSHFWYIALTHTYIYRSLSFTRFVLFHPILRSISVMCITCFVSPAVFFLAQAIF